MALTCSALIKLYKLSWIATTPSATPVVTTPEPHPVDLVGQWEPDAATMTRLTKLGIVTTTVPAPPRLVLQQNSYRLERIPYWDNQKLPRIFFASWTGGWNFYGWNNTALYLYGGEVDVRGQILGERPPYQLSLIVGDPVSNEPLLFTKRPN